MYADGEQRRKTIQTLLHFLFTFFRVCWRMMLYTDVRVQWRQTESCVRSSKSMINVMMCVSVFESIRFKSCFRNSTEEKETLGCANHCVMCVSCLYLLLYRLLYHVMSLMNRSSGAICRTRHVCLDECVKYHFLVLIN